MGGNESYDEEFKNGHSSPDKNENLQYLNPEVEKVMKEMSVCDMESENGGDQHLQVPD